MWVHGVILVLGVSGLWSLDSGTNQSPSVISNTTPPHNSTVNTGIENETQESGQLFNKTVSRDVNLGNDVQLTCTNKTWSEMMYTLWEISLKSEVCKIGSSDDGQSHNNCSTSKALHNTSSGESYLLIPNFSNSDEGVYKCESAYKGGSYSVNFQVFVKVRPTLSGSLEWRGSRWVAVCSAARGKPAASIVWRYTGNGSSVPTDSLTEKHQDGSYTVESQLALPEGVAPGNLTCAVDHPYWEEEQTVMLTVSSMDAAADLPWTPLLISGIGLMIIVILLGSLYLARKKLIIRHCWQSNTTPSESKSPPAEDVEEVEPYASYVQRVNSIYNSSVDLFT